MSINYKMSEIDCNVNLQTAPPMPKIDFNVNLETVLPIPEIDFNVNLETVLPMPEIDCKVNFRKVWPCVGYSSQRVAKRSLTRHFKEGIDFDVRSTAQVANVFPGLSEDLDSRAEIIMLTFRCTLDFLTIVMIAAHRPKLTLL